MDISNVLKNSRILLGTNLDEEKLEFAAKRGKRAALDYCGLHECTEEGFEDICAEIAADIYRAENESKDTKSIKEGDVTLTFFEGSSKGTERILDYKSRLERYRKILWK